MRARVIWSIVNTFTFSPDRRATCRASSATSSGDFAPAGSLTRSRAHRTAFAISAPRASAAFTFAFVRPSTTTCDSFEAVASPLYLRNWYDPRCTPSASACAAAASIDRVGHRLEQSRRDVRDLRRAAGQRRARLANRIRVELLGIADTDEDHGFGAELALRRDGEGLAALPAEVGLVHEIGEVAPERAVDRFGTRAEAALGEHGNCEQVGAHLVGGGTTGFDRERHGSGVYGFREKYPTA